MENKIFTAAAESLNKAADSLKVSVGSRIQEIVPDRPALQKQDIATVDKPVPSDKLYSSVLTVAGLCSLVVGVVTSSKPMMGIGGVASVAGVLWQLLGSKRAVAGDKDKISTDNTVESNPRIVSGLIDLSQKISDQWQKDVEEIKNKIYNDLEASGIDDNSKADIRDICMRYSLVELPDGFASRAQKKLEAGETAVNLRLSLQEIFDAALNNALREQLDIYSEADKLSAR